MIDPHRTTPGDESRLAMAAILTGCFMLLELVGGLIAQSLALIADAGHMLTDTASLFLAWLAIRIAQRPATWQRSYGFGRFSVLAAFVNGIALFAIAAWISVEAVQRMLDPPTVMAPLMLGIAVAGLLVNVLVFFVLRGHHHQRQGVHDLNTRAAILHVIGDLLGSVAAIVAALTILGTGWMLVDPLLSILVSMIILRAAWRVVAQSGNILLEAAPSHIDIDLLGHDLVANVRGLQAVDHVHCWSITEDQTMITLEAKVGQSAPIEATRTAIKQRLAQQFQIYHAIVELSGLADEVSTSTSP